MNPRETQIVDTDRETDRGKIYTHCDKTMPTISPKKTHKTLEGGGLRRKKKIRKKEILRKIFC